MGQVTNKFYTRTKFACRNLFDVGVVLSLDVGFVFAAGVVVIVGLQSKNLDILCTIFGISGARKG